jgi:hypothetical protein
MVIAIGILLVVFAFVAPLFIRPSDLPPPELPSPTQHLEDRKAAIYENLRDLQGEYHMGKLSDDDYQHTKLDIQKELAGVLAEIEKIESELESSDLGAEASTSA